MEGLEIGERLGALEKYFNVGYGDGKFVGAYVGNDDGRSDGNCEGERLIVTSLEVGFCVGLKDM